MAARSDDDRRVQAARDAFATIYASVSDSRMRTLSLAETARRGLPRDSLERDLTAGSMSFDAMQEGLAAVAPCAGSTFIDLGSGVGCAVIAAALLCSPSWSKCIGVEVLGDLHEEATQAAKRLCRGAESTAHQHKIEFICDDLFSVSLRHYVNVVVFCCCVTWSHDIMHRLARKLAEELDGSARVLTVGKPLPHRVELSEGSVTFPEVWHGVARLDWGCEVLVLHNVVRCWPSRDEKRQHHEEELPRVEDEASDHHDAVGVALDRVQVGVEPLAGQVRQRRQRRSCAVS